MDAEPAETDPQLSIATTDELIEELGRRFPDHVFCGRGTGRADGKESWSIHLLGDQDVRVGLAQRLSMVVRRRMRDELGRSRVDEEEVDDD